MDKARSSPVLGGPISMLYNLGAAGTMTDGQLLDRFLARNDPDASEAAFTALVDRHGPMVLSICRQLLGDPHDAHDAFQATFLVLVSKAGSIRRREAVGGWLFGIARRVAARSQVEADRADAIFRSCSRTGRPRAATWRLKRPHRAGPTVVPLLMRSTGCRNSFARRWSCTTSRDSAPRPRRNGWAARAAPCCRGCRGHGAGSRSGWRGNGCRSRHLLSRWRDADRGIPPVLGAGRAGARDRQGRPAALGPAAAAIESVGSRDGRRGLSRRASPARW